MSCDQMRGLVRKFLPIHNSDLTGVGSVKIDATVQGKQVEALVDAVAELRD